MDPRPVYIRVLKQVLVWKDDLQIKATREGMPFDDLRKSAEALGLSVVWLEEDKLRGSANLQEVILRWAFDSGYLERVVDMLCGMDRRQKSALEREELRDDYHCSINEEALMAKVDEGRLVGDCNRNLLTKLMMKELHNTLEQFFIESEQIDAQDSDSRPPPQKRRKCDDNLRLPADREVYLDGIKGLAFRAKLGIVLDTDESYSKTLGMLYEYCKRNVQQKILLKLTVEEVLGWEEMEEGQKIEATTKKR